MSSVVRVPQTPPVPSPWLSITVLQGRTGLRLTGDADRLSLAALCAAARSLPADTGEIHLQLAGLEFIDVAATRFLLTLAERPGRPALTLHYPPPAMIRLIRMLWPEAMAGMSVRLRTEAPGDPGS